MQHYVGFSIKNRIKMTNRPNTPKITNGLVQHITGRVHQYTVGLEGIQIVEVSGEGTIPINFPLSYFVRGFQ